MPLLYHAYVYLEFLILACTIYILAPVKVLVENKRGGNDYKSVLEILNIYQAVGDMHFIGERDYFNKIEKKLEKELETDGGSL